VRLSWRESADVPEVLVARGGALFHLPNAFYDLFHLLGALFEGVVADIEADGLLENFQHCTRTLGVDEIAARLAHQTGGLVAAALAQSEEESGNADDTAGGEASPDRDTSAEASATDSDPLDRGALFIGLGDAVMPTVLVASAVAFTPGAVAVSTIGGLPYTVPALGAMVGTFVGLAVLVRMVLAGRAHAGLPMLNGGAIAGYLVGSLAVGVDLLVALGVTTV